MNALASFICVLLFVLNVVHSAIPPTVKVFAWGPLIGSAVPYSAPMTGTLLENKTITKITGGNGFVLALTSDNELFSNGAGTSGQLGNGAEIDSALPVAVDMTGELSGKTVSQVVCASATCLVLTSDNGLFTWGLGTSGQLGNGADNSSNVPVAVDMTGVLSGKNISQIALNDLNTFFVLTTEGKVYSWGQGVAGELGNDGTENSNVPVAVEMTGVLSGKTVSQIAGSLVLASDNKLYSWGFGSNGELGNGADLNSSLPVAVDMTGVLSGKTVSKFCMGWANAIVLTSDNMLYTWGYGLEGQLGNGADNSSNVPVAVDMTGVLSGKNISQIACAYENSYVVTSDDLLFSWGIGFDGKLGNGGNNNSNVPVAADVSAFTGRITIFSSPQSDNGFALDTFCGEHQVLGNNECTCEQGWSGNDCQIQDASSSASASASESASGNASGSASASSEQSSAPAMVISLVALICMIVL